MLRAERRRGQRNELTILSEDSLVLERVSAAAATELRINIENGAMRTRLDETGLTRWVDGQTWQRIRERAQRRRETIERVVFTQLAKFQLFSPLRLATTLAVYNDAVRSSSNRTTTFFEEFRLFFEVGSYATTPRANRMRSECSSPKEL